MASALGVPYVTANQMYAAATVLPLVGMTFVGVRVRRRVRSKAGLGWDDWFLVIAMLLNAGGAISLLIGLQNGAFGYPTPNLQGLTAEQKATHVDATMILTEKLQLAHLLLVALAYGFLKLSIIYFYRRIFVTQSGSTFDWACRAAAAMSVVWTLGIFLALSLQCGTNISAAWGSVADGSQYCQAFFHVQAGYVISDLFTNCLIWLLPVPMIWRLQLARGKKICLFALFGLSALSIIACIIKLYATMQFAYIGFSPEIDLELTLSTILYWCTVEGGVAIIATCLPDLYYYVDLFLKGEAMSSLRSKLSLSSTTSGNSSGRRSMVSNPSRSPMLPKHGSYISVRQKGSPLATPDSCPMVDPMQAPCQCKHARPHLLRNESSAYSPEPGYVELDAAKTTILVTKHYSIGSDYIV